VSDLNSNVNKMIDTAIDNLDKILIESRKYLLQKEVFDRCIAAWQRQATDLIQLITTPAIAIRDVNGKIHFMVTGEKWKLFMRLNLFYSEKGSEGRSTIICTNPVEFICDKFEVDKSCVIKALRDYEEIYDASIMDVMAINDKVAALQSLNSNGEKLDNLQEASNMIRAAIKRNREITDVVAHGN